MDSNKRIVYNTLAQHFRAVLSISMSLFSTRYILMALGNSDFGIFSLIGSTVTMLGFITNALVVTTQRHLSFSHGAGKESDTKAIFSNSMFVHLIIGMVILLILAVLEPFLFDGILEIEANRVTTAQHVYFVVTIMLFISLITSPFRALFIARENIVYISIVDTLNGVFRLALAIPLLYVNADKLITYTWMMFSISVFNLLAFSIYAKRKFPETCLLPKRKEISKHTIIQIIDFAGWTCYSTACIVGRTQGMAIVLNNFFGTIINTAYGIASQVSVAIQFVSQAVLNAMSPQIIKAEGKKEHRQMLSLAEQLCKYSFLLLALIVIPISFEISSILQLWLGDTPSATAEICRFLLITALVDQTTIGLNTAIQAIGNIRNYSLTINTIKVATLLIAYISLSLGFGVTSAMWCYVVVEAVCAIIRLPFLKHSAGLSIMEYISVVFVKLIPSTLCMLAISYISTHFIHSLSGVRFLLTIFLSATAGLVCIWTTAMNKEEKDAAIRIIKNKK
ncbi:MAG: hypothetical protein ACI3Y0_02565 [Prevotella sp.]